MRPQCGGTRRPLLQGKRGYIALFVSFCLLPQETKTAVMQGSDLCCCLVDAAAIADISHVAGGSVFPALNSTASRLHPPPSFPPPPLHRRCVPRAVSRA